LKKIPVIAFANKSKVNRYLAASMDFGDWEDPDLDVKQEEIENAFMIWRNDLTKPTEQDLENLKAESAAHKKNMHDKFGPDAMVSFDMEEILEHYEPLYLEITQEQYEIALSLVE
jgi:hypothetical protein